MKRMILYCIVLVMLFMNVCILEMMEMGGLGG